MVLIYTRAWAGTFDRACAKTQKKENMIKNSGGGILELISLEATPGDAG